MKMTHVSKIFILIEFHNMLQYKDEQMLWLTPAAFGLWWMFLMFILWKVKDAGCFSATVTMTDSNKHRWYRNMHSFIHTHTHTFQKLGFNWDSHTQPSPVYREWFQFTHWAAVVWKKIPSYIVRGQRSDGSEMINNHSAQREPWRSWATTAGDHTSATPVC